MTVKKMAETTSKLDEVATENVDELTNQDEKPIFATPDEICTGCKHLVLSVNAIYWPQMCFRNKESITNLWANDKKQPLRSAECMEFGWKSTDT